MNDDNFRNSIQNDSNNKNKIILIIMGIIIILLLVFGLFGKIFKSNNNNDNDTENKTLNENNKKEENKKLIDLGNLYYDEITRISGPYKYDPSPSGTFLQKVDIAKNSSVVEVEQNDVKKLLKTEESRKLSNPFVYNNYLYFVAQKGNYSWDGGPETRYFLRKNLNDGALELLAKFEGACHNFFAANGYIIFGVKDDDVNNKAHYYSFNLENYSINKIHNVVVEIQGLNWLQKYVLPLVVGDKVLFVYNNEYIYASDLNGQKIDEKAYDIKYSSLFKFDNYVNLKQVLNKDILDVEIKYYTGNTPTYENFKLNLLTGKLN